MMGHAPLVRIGTAALIGVVCARYLPLPLSIIIICALVCYLFSWLAVRHKLSNAYLLVAIAFTFMLNARLNTQSITQNDFFSDIQTQSFERLQRLNMPADELGSVAAMSIGYKGAMSEDVAQSYRASGMAHIMAVSGLHVGIVFLMVNILLRWICVFWHYAHRFLPYIAIVLIWSYVVLSGASPSAVRAGAMFSLVQIAMSLSLHTNLLNVLFGAGVIMVAVSPSNIFNVSFQMSFLALLSIALWYIPLYRLIKTPYAVLNFIYGGILISVVASVALAPLVSYYFARVSFASVLVMPVASLTAYLIIPLAMLWVVAPLTLFAPVFSKLLYWAAHIQNSLTEWGASLAAIDFRLTFVEMLLFYALYISLTLLFVGREKDLPLSYDNAE